MYNKLFTLFTAMMILCLLLSSCGGTKISTVESTATTQPTTPLAKVVPSTTPRPATLAATNVQPTLNPTSIPATNNILTIGTGWWQDPWMRNFNPFSSSWVFIPKVCIFEPLMVYNTRTGELLPWLATGYQWGEDNQTLAFTIRKGVQWSDGEPFGVEDVVATFKMIMAHPDITGTPGYSYPLSDWLNTYVSDISTPDAFTVMFRFQIANTQALFKLAAEVILPKHIWGQLPNPKDFANPNPVGTGPFTEVTVFEDKQAGFERILQIERNPYYWQEGKPYFQGVKFSFRHDEDTLADMTQGKLDWAAIQFPDIQKDFLDIDPSHYQVLVDTYPYMNLLQLNTTLPPFDNPDVRKAISMGIDRQQIVKSISQGFIDPANATGLGDRYKSWWNEAAISAGTWVGSNAFEANTLLNSLGFKKGVDGTRTTPDGKPMVYKLIIDPSYPDQAAVAQAISLNLANIGVVVSVSPAENWWDAFQTDNYDMALFAGYRLGITPYEFYLNLMSPSGMPLPGAKTNQLAGRYTSAEVGSLLDEFIHESDLVRQKAIMDKIQTIFVEDAPSIPLYPTFSFIEYNTLRFTGFPSTEDPYAEGNPGDILVLLNIKPR